jgi:hypothetical protein
VVVRGVCFERHLDGILRALADERAAGEVGFAGLDAVIDCRMKRKRSCHVGLLQRNLIKIACSYTAAGRFTEGFDTQDLKDADALLAELS